MDENKLHLTNSTQKAFIDAENFTALNKKRWYLHNEYVTTNLKVKGRYKTTYLHQLIISPKKGFDTDHINGNKLDNRKINLRYATRSNNKANAGAYITSKTGFKGVRKNWNKWDARITKNYKTYYLGLFDSIDKAKDAYNLAAKEMFGEYAKPN